MIPGTRRRRLWPLIAAAIACGGVTAAGQPPQSPQARPPRFTANVDVVSVDVNVVDAAGRPVRDLTAPDFTLTVDGKVRKIVSAQFVSLTAPESTGPPTAAALQYTTNAGGPPGRLIAIVVDRGSIEPVRSKDVFTAASRFVDGLQPSDRVALFSIPEGPALDFTTNHDAVQEALLTIDGNMHGSSGIKSVSIAEALGFERGDSLTIQNVMQRECGVTVLNTLEGGVNGESAICVRQVSDEASTIAAYTHERARNTVNGLRSVLDRLGSSDTPKTIVLISEGLVIDNERLVTAGLGQMLAAAHATIYALKPEPSDSDASRARAPQNTAQERTVKETGLSLVTALGGGEMFRVIANPDSSFARLASELSGYYLLGFEPEAGDRDGKPHGIHVAVARGGLQVRSRAQFTVGAANRDTEHVMADLLRSPAFATGVPLRMTTYAFQDPDSSKIRLLVALEADRTDRKGKMALGLVAIKPDGTTVQTFYQPSIDARTDGAGTQTCFATLLVDPGTYRLRAAVIDADGRQGSLERHIRASMTRMARYRATEMIIGDGDAQSAGSITPTVTGRMTGEQLHAYMELFADVPDGFAGTTAVLEVTPSGSTTVVDSAPAALAPAGNDPHVRAVAGSIPLKLLPAGDYEVRAVISVDGHPIGQMTRAFTVVKPRG
jgi:VWFA-related protein